MNVLESGKKALFIRPDTSLEFEESGSGWILVTTNERLQRFMTCKCRKSLNGDMKYYCKDTDKVMCGCCHDNCRIVCKRGEIHEHFNISGLALKTRSDEL